MNYKPVKARQHGIIDYVFSGIQLALPHLLHLNRSTRIAYSAMGGAFLAMNAISDTPAAIRPKISFKAHQQADACFLAALAALTAAGFIRKRHASRAFHLAFLGSAVSHFILTDYDNNGQ